MRCFFGWHDWPKGYEMYDTFHISQIWYLRAQHQCCRCDEIEKVIVLTHEECPK